jgi:hypothetical protein
MGGPFHYNGSKSSTADQPNTPLTQTSLAQPSAFYAPAQPPSIDLYGQPANPSLHPGLPATPTGSFGNQAGMQPVFNSSEPSQMQPGGPQAQQTMQQQQQYHFDPSDPALFNFDISSLNFGNHYGAMEFHFLDHMSSRAHDVNSNGPDMVTPMGQVQTPVGQPQQQHQQAFPDNSLMFGQEAMSNVDWASARPPAPPSNAELATPQNTPVAPVADRTESVSSNQPLAYTIGARPNSLASASPLSTAQDAPGSADGNPQSPSAATWNLHSSLTGSSTTSKPSALLSRATSHQPVQPLSKATNDNVQMTVNAGFNLARKRPRDADSIYDRVKVPYPYTSGFHKLFGFLRAHFSREAVERIARALSIVRPSLITYAQGLTDRDLVHMEVTLQRSLYEYEYFIKTYGTPTIIARRDGAIVASSQEFTILTGWSKAVLVGKEPNLNVNVVQATGASTAVTSGRGTRRTSAEPEESNGTERGNVGSSSNNAGQSNGNGIGTSTGIGTGTGNSGNVPPPAVFIAEILDQDTVVQFYEDYSTRAFGDPDGSVPRRGRILKYRTKDTEADSETADASEGGERLKKRLKIERQAKDDSMVNAQGEPGINRLGEKEGVVDCMYCWNVRRDSFELPQLIIMNVS